MSCFFNATKRLGVVLLLLSLSAVVRADFVVDIQDSTITSGGKGYVDVLVWNTGASDSFSLFNYKFQITEVNTVNGGTLEFRSSFSLTAPNDIDRQSNSEQFLANYIFAGSADAINFAATRQDTAKDQLSGGDNRSAGNINFSATPSSPSLLARLELQHITPNPDSSTGTFRIELVKNSALTYFQNLELLDDDPLQPIIAESSYTNYGFVSIITAVPEPSSFVLLCISGLALLRRRRHIQN
ncbi:MAG: PEP-CTERM sorting domain-containing protein [Pirellulales bacterium]